ncbi:MAG TPA: hypothetical protein VMF89_12745, partial [Polyangiales bacterium]|nr:hypothetical protein [Polyangiales bacterium]
ADLKFAFSRFGTFQAYAIKFKAEPPYGLEIGQSSSTPTEEQAEDEAVVYKTKVAVTPMQVGFEARPLPQAWLRRHLSELFAE